MESLKPAYILIKLGVVKFVTLPLVLLVAFYGLAACSFDSSETVSEADQRTIKRGTNLSREFLAQSATFLERLGEARFAEAQISLNRMKGVSETRLRLMISLENEKLRQFFVGAQSLTDRNVQLYQRALNAAQRQAPLYVFNRLQREEERLAQESTTYLRRESRRLLELGSSEIKEALEQQRAIEKEYFGSAP